MTVTRNENREADALAISRFDLVTEQDGRYVFTAVPRTDHHVTFTGDNMCEMSEFSVSGSVLTSANAMGALCLGPRSPSPAFGSSSLWSRTP